MFVLDTLLVKRRRLSSRQPVTDQLEVSSPVRVEFVNILKMSYVLVFWSDPVSSSVVHKNTIIGSFETGKKSYVKWHGKEILALIVATGEYKLLQTIDMSVIDDVL